MRRNFQAGNAQLGSASIIGTSSANTATVGNLTATGTASLQETTFANASDLGHPRPTCSRVWSVCHSLLISLAVFRVWPTGPCPRWFRLPDPRLRLARGSFATSPSQLFGGFVGALLHRDLHPHGASAPPPFRAVSSRTGPRPTSPPPACGPGRRPHLPRPDARRSSRLARRRCAGTPSRPT